MAPAMDHDLLQMSFRPSFALVPDDVFLRSVKIWRIDRKSRHRLRDRSNATMQRIARYEDKVAWPHMPCFVADHELGFTFDDNDNFIMVRLRMEFAAAPRTGCDVRSDRLSVTYEHALDRIALRRRIGLKLLDDLM